MSPYAQVNVTPLVELLKAGRLRYLNLSSNPLDDDAAIQLAGCIRQRQQQVSCPSGGWYPARGIALVSLSTLGLHELVLCGTKVGDSGATSLIKSLHQDQLLRYVAVLSFYLTAF